MVPIDSKLGLAEAKDLTKPEVKRIAVGNPDSVPSGRYTKAALTTAGLWDTLQPKYVFGASVRQALTRSTQQKSTPGSFTAPTPSRAATR